MIIPIFTSAYSFRSILNLEKESDPKAADSIFQICDENAIDKVFIVEDNMSSFMHANKNCGSKTICYGVRFWACENLPEIDAQDSSNWHRVILFALNSQGCSDLIKVYSKSATDFSVKEKPVLNLSWLRNNWSDNLLMAIPFYDSFLHLNSMKMSKLNPDLKFANPVFFLEDNDLFFDSIIGNAVFNYVDSNGGHIQKTKSIYYKEKKDFFAWQTYKCIQNGGTLRVPNLEGCASDLFCIESWKESREEKYANYSAPKPFSVSVSNGGKYKGVCFDFETEDLNLCHTKPWQLGMVLFDESSILEEIDAKLFWEDFCISKEAAFHTKFDFWKWKKEAKDPRLVMERANKIFESCDFIVGHNLLGFDVHVYRSTCRRLGIKALPIEEKIIDTLPCIKGIKLNISPNPSIPILNWQVAMSRYVSAETRKRGFATLSAMATHFGIDFDPEKLHDGLYDSALNVNCFRRVASKLGI